MFDPRLEICPLCKEGELTPFDRDFRGRTIDRCRECGVLLMNPQYSDDHLAEFYAGYLSVHDRGAPLATRWRSRADVRREGKHRSLELLARYCEGRRRLLMVGCGDGLELTVAGELGWEAEGYDVDPTLTSRVAERFGVPVHCGRFEDLDLNDGWFDAIFMDQVLEHLKDPEPYLRTCRRLLVRRGMLYLGLPNIGSLANRTKTWLGKLGLKRERRGSHYATKHHLFYFSPAVLRRVLPERYGFEVVHVCGSLKPDRKPLTPVLARRFPGLDSGFVLLARKSD